MNINDKECVYNEHSETVDIDTEGEGITLSFKELEAMYKYCIKQRNEKINKV